MTQFIETPEFLLEKRLLKGAIYETGSSSWMWLHSWEIRKLYPNLENMWKNPKEGKEDMSTKAYPQGMKYFKVKSTPKMSKITLCLIFPIPEVLKQNLATFKKSVC